MGEIRFIRVIRVQKNAGTTAIIQMGKSLGFGPNKALEIREKSDYRLYLPCAPGKLRERKWHGIQINSHSF